MSTQADEVLTVHEAAELLGVSVETLRRWRRRGTGPDAHRAGPRLVRYRRAAVLDWLSGQERA